MTKRLSVMQLTDTLDAGGAERVAVNLANLLPRDRFISGLCTTRRDGALTDLVAPDVERLSLRRRARFDIAAVQRLTSFIRARGVQVLHAHGSAVFVGLAASCVPPYPTVVWHVHYGHHVHEGAPWVYRLAAKRIRAIITVNHGLAEWVHRALGVPRARVRYIPNFSCVSMNGSDPQLRGRPGSRLVAVANLRPEKDHGTLIRAMAIVVRDVPHAHLHLVGHGPDPSYANAIQEQIVAARLENHVTMLGERRDVGAILSASDVGVLSSTAEGFPLALVEYGQAGLPVVATQVGECPDVLDFGKAGLLVEPRNPEQLAGALRSLLHSEVERRRLGEQLRRRVQELYSPGPIVEQICAVYTAAIGVDASLPSDVLGSRSH